MERSALPRIIILLPALAMLPGAAGVVAQPLPGITGQPLLAERFDSTLPPALPAGWSTSVERSPGGDFVTTETGAFSPPSCAAGSNATVAQWLMSPPVDLSGWRACTLSWMERRSASHDASIVLEASADGGSSFLPATPEPLQPQGGTAWIVRTIPLPSWAEGLPSVLLRWRVQGDGTGTAGTIRYDDLLILGDPRWDISIAPDSISPRRPAAGGDVRCLTRIVNSGFETATGVKVEWSVDLDSDGLPDGPDPAASETIGMLLPGDSVSSGYSLTLPDRGAARLIAIVSADTDLITANDTALFRIAPAAAPRSVIINEIMYDPLPEKPEYVELFNRSPDSVRLAGWRLTDEEEDSTRGILATEFVTLGPGGYLVCSPDSGVRSAYPVIPAEAPVVEVLRGLTLNNAGDLLLLADETGWPIDRIEYSPDWHTPSLDETQGRSLERIESGSGESGAWNWGTSAGGAGGTPGARNSLSAERASPVEDLNFSPNPFSPDGDGFEDVTVIGYRLGALSAVARVRIYDREGRLVRILTGSSYVAGTGSFVWNGYDDRGWRAPVGIYVVLLDAVDGSGREAFTARGVVVVAGRL